MKKIFDFGAFANHHDTWEKLLAEQMSLFLDDSNKNKEKIADITKISREDWNKFELAYYTSYPILDCPKEIFLLKFEKELPNNILEREINIPPCQRLTMDSVLKGFKLPERPREPQLADIEEPKLEAAGGSIICIPLFFIFSFFELNSPNSGGFLLFLWGVLCCIIAIWDLMAVKKYFATKKSILKHNVEQRKINAYKTKKYEDENKAYNARINEIKIQAESIIQKDFDEKVKRRDDEIMIAKKKLYYKYLQVRKAPKAINGTTLIRTGLSEEEFYTKLRDVFGAGVLRNRAVDCYYPDILIYDAERLMGIDVEIDEPYDLETKSPIHTTNDPFKRDENRDIKMNVNRYTVIRFAEEQIVRFPDDCVRFVQSVYSFLINFDNKDSINFEFPIKRWNVSEARELAINNSRIQYLNRTN